MKKLLLTLLCVIWVCGVVVSCDKDEELPEEIQYENDETTKLPPAQNDDPNNGYGDIIVPND